MEKIEEDVSGDCLDLDIKLYDIEELDQNMEVNEDYTEKSESLLPNSLELKGTIATSHRTFSCMDFNSTGDFISTGDNGGKITIYRRNPSTDNYELYTKILNHDPRFDACPIKQIEWLEQKNPSQLLLVTNQNVIKLWKITQKDWEANREEFNFKDHAERYAASHGYWSSSIKIPKIIKSQKPDTIVRQSQIFENGHLYPIHSISLNSDQETFLSGCEYHINLWNFQVTKEASNLVDFDQVTTNTNDYITTASFHPSSCSWFAYGSLLGEIRLCDMRKRALCDKHSKLFLPDQIEYLEYPTQTISDLQWSNSGRLLASRDYMTVKIWDPNMESKPVEVWPIQDYLKAHLKRLHRDERLEDSFKIKWKQDDNEIVTGGYNKFFSIIDRSNSNINQLQTYQTSQSSIQTINSFPTSTLNPVNTKGNFTLDSYMNIVDVPKLAGNPMDFDSKIITHSWHPKENETIVVGTKKNLLMYQQKKYQNY